VLLLKLGESYEIVTTRTSWSFALMNAIGLLHYKLSAWENNKAPRIVYFGNEYTRVVSFTLRLLYPLLPRVQTNSSTKFSTKSYNDIRPRVAQAVSRLPLTVHAHVRCQASPCVMDKVALKHVFLLVLRFYPVGIITPVLHTLIAWLSHRRYISLVDIKHPSAPSFIIFLRTWKCAMSVLNVLTLVLQLY
jgi:hypothetical protein